MKNITLKDLDITLDEFQALVEMASNLEKRTKLSFKYSDLYYEYLGKDNDYMYLFKRAFKLLWLDIKIKFKG